MSFVSVATPKLIELVGEQIRCDIGGGAFRRDRKLLAERAMTARCGVSYGGVREASTGGRRGEHTQGESGEQR